MKYLCYILLLLSLFIMGCPINEHSFMMSIHITPENLNAEYKVLMPFPLCKSQEGEQFLFNALNIQGDASMKLLDSTDFDELDIDDVPCEFYETGGLFIEGSGEVTISGSDETINLTQEIDIFTLPMYLLCNDSQHCGPNDNGVYLFSEDQIQVDYRIEADYYCGPTCAGIIEAVLNGDVAPGWNKLKLFWVKCLIS